MGTALPKNTDRKLVVVGGGAAGLMAAYAAAKRGLSVTILERNARMGRKLLITGKGRCNITNNCSVPDFIANVPQNGRFLFGAGHDGLFRGKRAAGENGAREPRFPLLG